MRKRDKVLGAIAIIVAALLSLGCNEPPPTAPTPITINIHNNQQQGGATPGATPSPSPVQGLGFDSVRVGIFQHNASCSTAPRNGEQIVRLGCTASITATPKLNGNDVPPSVHGSSCIWFLNGARVDGLAQIPQVDVSVDSANPFNVQVRGKAPGQFRLAVDVKGFRTDDSVFAVE